MFVIFDNKKNSYVKEINKRIVSQAYEVVTTKSMKNAFKFTNEDHERLRHLEKLLKYEPYTLEFREV